jgi:DNA topoisomerase-6 subunit B
MLKETKAPTLTQFLTKEFSRVSPGIARKICEAASVSPRANTKRIGRHEADALFAAIQQTKVSAPATDCISPLGEDLLLKGLHHLVPGEFYAAATRPPAVYRGNPFLIEVGLAYGGAPATHRVPRETLVELLSQSDARTLRQFLTTTFDGLGSDASDKIIHAAGLRRRMTPGRLAAAEIARLHEAMQNVSLDDRQTMTVLRYANRVPLQFQAGACAITETVASTNWRSYGLSQPRGSLPHGPVTVMVHMASVWVPFTSESKEAIAGYPEIQKELRLAMQAVGRKLGMFLRRRLKAKHQGQRRDLFLRYLGEVAGAVSRINGADRDALYEQLVKVAKRKTTEADAQYDNRGRRIANEADDFGENVLIVDREAPAATAAAVATAASAAEASGDAEEDEILDDSE